VSRDIPIEQVTVLGKHVDECRAWLPEQPGRRARWHYFQSIPIPPRLDRKPAAWVDDKRAFKKHFVRAGLPIAYGASVCTLSGALRVFRQINGPVIVKPRSGSRARHTSVNVVTETDFIAAYKRARELCAFVMIEACIPGDTYRVTCVGGRVIGAIHFVKPHVVADGSSTCDELLYQYNQNLLEGVAPVKRNGPYKDALTRQGFTSKDVPSAGLSLILAEHSERANGGYNEDITDRLPETVCHEIERAARLCGLAVIGFDIISRDLANPTEPFTFIEGNSLPFIDIHHDPTYGTPRNVAGAVWDLWFNEA
jgi:cyanophycin synthetase